jgi:hypothetical protein
MAQILCVPFVKFYDNNGNPLAGGMLYSYAAGTTTPLATYTNETQASTNTNPVILDANGSASVWIGSAAYKFILMDSSSNVIWTVDNVSSINPGGLTQSMFPTGILTADAPGRAIMANGYITAAQMAVGALSNDATGRGVMAAGYLSLDTTGQALMANGYVGQNKRAALPYQLSASCGSFNSTSVGRSGNVTNLSVTITTTGRPVFIALVDDGNGASFGGVETSARSINGSLGIYRGTGWNGTSYVGTPIGFANLPYLAGVSGGTTISTLISGLSLLDIGATAGSNTYTVTCATTYSSCSLTLSNVKLFAYEL